MGEDSTIPIVNRNLINTNWLKLHVKFSDDIVDGDVNEVEHLMV